MDASGSEGVAAELSTDHPMAASCCFLVNDDNCVLVSNSLPAMPPERPILELIEVQDLVFSSADL